MCLLAILLFSHLGLDARSLFFDCTGRLLRLNAFYVWLLNNDLYTMYSYVLDAAVYHEK